MRIVAEKQLPFALKVPNVEIRAAMAEANAITDAHNTRFGSTVELFDDLEKNSGQ